MSKIKDKNLLNIAIDNTKEYGSYTVENRAIPDYKDGCKPIHRKIIWAMYIKNYNSNSQFVKVAKVLGDTIGGYSPHGSSGAYSGLITIANMYNSLLDKQGNYGSADGDSPAAERYIETRLSKLTEKLLLDKNYLAVTPMVDNYDGTLKEPVYLPSKLPMILLMGSEGIATGTTTLIPSFSYESVKKLILKLAKNNRECKAKDCMNLDFVFQYGGKNINTEKELLNYYKTGTEKLVFTIDTEIDEKHRIIYVKSLAPRITPSKIVETLKEYFPKDIKDVSNVMGHKSDYYVKIEVRPNVDIKELALKIEKKYSYNMNTKTIVTDRQSDSDIKFLKTTIPNIINSWFSWRIEFEKLVVNRLIKNTEDLLINNNWLLWAVNNRKLILQCLEQKDPLNFLIKKGKISKEQADFTLNLQVKRLAKLETKPLEKKIKELKQEITDLNNSIKNTKSIYNRIYQGIKMLK